MEKLWGRESFYIPSSPAPSFDLNGRKLGDIKTVLTSLYYNNIHVLGSRDQPGGCPQPHSQVRKLGSFLKGGPYLEADLELQVPLTHRPPYSTLHPPNLVDPILQTYAMGFRPPEVTLSCPLLCSTLISRTPKNHSRNCLVFKPVVPKEE